MKLKKEIKRFFTLKHKANNGFTLVELIVVIAILGVLGGVAVPVYSGYVEKANKAADDELLATLNKAYTVACVENGEYDMKNLSFTPETDGDIKSEVKMKKFNDSFQRYFEGGGVFKYYDVLGFNKASGIFMGDNIAARTDALKDSWNKSTFAAKGEEVLNMLSATFDQFSYYFSGNGPFDGGFSLDGVIATMPTEVQTAFGFGSYDITPEQEEFLLMRYVPEYAGMSDQEKREWKNIEANVELMNTIKGNAYVMNIANASTDPNVSAVGIKNDISNLLNALWNPQNYTGDKYDSVLEACNNSEIEKLEVYGLTPDMLAAVAASNVKNSSGISTLGSMYALAAGYLNSEEYQSAVANGGGNLANDISSFPNVLAAMNHGGFSAYLNGTKAVNDIDAYLNYMKYVSSNGVNMGDAAAFDFLGDSIWGIIGGSN